MIQQELATEKRIVLDTPGFVAFCPFASPLSVRDLDPAQEPRQPLTRTFRRTKCEELARRDASR